jgi:putative membrane protein
MFDTKHNTVLLVATIMSLLLEGCAWFQQTLPGVTLSDANVLSVLDSLSEGEIAAARLAQEKASAPEVQAFAGRVLNEHRQLIEATGRLATQLGVAPRPPALVSHLNDTHEEAMRALRTTSGPAFDRAYVEYEIQHHVTAFNFVEAAAQAESDPVLRQDLTRTGPDLLSHISAARALERHLGVEPRPVIAAR